MNPRETLSADEWEKIKKKKLKKVLKEAEVMEKLESRDHIVELKNYDYISNEKTTDILMRMELLTNLNDYLLGTAENSEIRLKEQVIKIGIDLCKGLEECEAERIVHCDIKPENIFVNKSNTFKLGDFGLSHKFAASSLLGSMGTRMYMSPEAAGYGKHIDYRSDIYSLGIVLYELLNDRKIPFSSDSFDSDKIEDAITRRMSGEKIVYPIHERGQLWTIIQKACQFESKDRYQHASEMRRDLEKLKYEERNDSIRNDLEITIESDIGSTIEEKSYRDKNTNYLEKIIDKQKGKKQGKETAGKGLTTKKKWKINSKQVTKLVTIGFIIMFFVGTQRVVSQPSGFKIIQEVQNFFGDCYYHGKYYEGAVSWYNKAASKGNVSAQINLGNCYYDGVGVKKDYKEAVEWYKKAAEQGDSSAQNGLGNCYYSGEGVEQDYKEAVKWYKKAAEQEYAEGQCSLGACYYNGEGVKKNYKEAVKWYKKAAEQGNARGQYNLGYCYEEGLGIKKNLEKALYWYKKAVDNGLEYAKEAKKRIEKQLE